MKFIDAARFLARSIWDSSRNAFRRFIGAIDNAHGARLFLSE